VKGFLDYRRKKLDEAREQTEVLAASVDVNGVITTSEVPSAAS
jgi:hypothetical protein